MEKKRLYILCACVLPLMICSGVVYSMFSLYLGETLGFDKTQIGLIFMTSALVGLITAPFFGRMADRLGRKLVISIAMADFIVVFIVYSVAKSYPLVWAIQLLEGASWVALGAAASAYVADILPSDRRGWGMGIYQQSYSVGWVVGPLLGGFLSDIIGSRTTFMLGAGLVVLGFIATLIYVKEPPRSPQNAGQLGHRP